MSGRCAMFLVWTAACGAPSPSVPSEDNEPSEETGIERDSGSSETVPEFEACVTDAELLGVIDVPLDIYPSFDESIEEVMHAYWNAVPHLAVGDLDGDLDADLVIAHFPRLTVWQNTGACTFSPIEVPDLGPVTTAIIMDLDADGHNDIVVSVGDETYLEGMAAMLSGDEPIHPDASSFLVVLWNREGEFIADTSVFTDPINRCVIDDPLGKKSPIDAADLVLGLESYDWQGGGLGLAVRRFRMCPTMFLSYDEASGQFLEFSASLPTARGQAGAFLSDLDGDRRADLFQVAWSGMPPGDNIHVSLRDGEAFLPPYEHGMTTAGSPMSCAVADIDLDGQLDVMCSDNTSPRFYQASAEGVFYDVTEWLQVDGRTWSDVQDGTAASTSTTWSTVFLDYDADGDPDAFLTGGYENIGEPIGRHHTFAYENTLQGFDAIHGELGMVDPRDDMPLAMVDIDKDGDPDMVQVSKLLEGDLRILVNEVGGDGYLRVVITSATGQPAFGSVVEALYDEVVIPWHVPAGFGYASRGQAIVFLSKTLGDPQSGDPLTALRIIGPHGNEVFVDSWDTSDLQVVLPGGTP